MKPAFILLTAMLLALVACSDGDPVRVDTTADAGATIAAGGWFISQGDEHEFPVGLRIEFEEINWIGGRSVHGNPQFTTGPVTVSVTSGNQAARQIGTRLSGSYVSVSPGIGMTVDGTRYEAVLLEISQFGPEAAVIEIFVPEPGSREIVPAELSDQNQAAAAGDMAGRPVIFRMGLGNEARLFCAHGGWVMTQGIGKLLEAYETR